MRKFIVKVNNQQFEVELEEVRNVNNTNSVKPSSEKVVKPSSNGNGSAAGVSAKGESVVAPMPGNIIKINVNKGDTVKHGQVLLVLEAMKMENEIKAHADGKVADIKVEQGQCINAGDVLVVIE
jgi:biotin carboxyl carrier protein